MTHDKPDWERYGSILEKMAESYSKSSRERQLERAFGEPMKRLLIRVLDRHDGRKRPALRELNERLVEHDEYDADANGKISPNTFYAWLNRYGLS